MSNTELTLTLQRYAFGADSTAGALYVDGKFFCYTCEDEERDEKVDGETAIPWGRYEITLRKEGGMHSRYSQSHHYRDFHRGMLWLRDVPNFEWIYIHPGNTDDHTEGCILPGMTALFRDGEHQVGNSRDAYRPLYERIVAAMDEGKQVFIEVKG